MEEKIGVVTGSLDQISVAVIQLTDGDLHVGDQVHITGRSTRAYAMGRITPDRARGSGAEAPRGSEVAMKMEVPVEPEGMGSFGSTRNDETVASRL